MSSRPNFTVTERATELVRLTTLAEYVGRQLSYMRSAEQQEQDAQALATLYELLGSAIERAYDEPGQPGVTERVLEYAEDAYSALEMDMPE